jgi:hypothetical protein
LAEVFASNTSVRLAGLSWLTKSDFGVAALQILLDIEETISIVFVGRWHAISP